jgi:hypothetical protein
MRPSVTGPTWLLSAGRHCIPADLQRLREQAHAIVTIGSWLAAAT